MSSGLILPYMQSRRSPDESYTAKIRRLCDGSLIGHWALDDVAGAVAFDTSDNNRHGANSNVTLNQAGIGEGRTSGKFNGTTSFVNIYSAALAAAFNGGEGTAFIWAKVTDSSIWTDNAARRFFRFHVDANNFVTLYKFTDNVVNFDYDAGGTRKNFAASPAITDVNWFSIAMTWSKINDQAIGYYNGVRSGAIQSSLGTFAGSLASNATCLGSATTTPTLLWSGWLAHMVLCNAALSAEAIANLARVS